MNTNMIVTIKESSESMISIQLFDRIMRRSDRFIIEKTNVTGKLFEDRHLIDVDLLNTVTMSLQHDDTVHVAFNFIHEGINHTLTGYRRSFYLPVCALENAVEGYTTRLLIDADPPQTKSRIILHNCGSESLDVIPKKQRRALSKALRNNFNWPESVVHLYKYGANYDFEEDDMRHGCGMCGGLVLHETKVRGYDGKLYTKLYYSVHT